MIIDAHHHLWDPGARRHAWLDGLPSLRRPFGLDDFAPLAAIRPTATPVSVSISMIQMADVPLTPRAPGIVAHRIPLSHSAT